MGELLRRFVFSKYRAKVVVGVASKVVEVIFDLLTPIIVARMIDLGVAGHDTSVVVRLGLLLVVFAGIGYCFTLVCQKIAAIVSQGSGTDVRNALFEKVNALSSADVDEFGTPSLVTRITNDVNQVQVTVALGIRQLIRWPLLAVGSMVAALLIDLHLGLVFIVCTPVIALVFWVVMTRSVPYFQSMQSKLDRVSLVTREALSGIRVIRAFGRGRHEETRFRKAADDQTDTAIAVGKLSAILNPATFLVMNLGVVVILWVGGGRVNAGDLTQGEVVAFVNYMTQTLLSIVYVANLVVTFTRGAASATRIVEVLDREVTIGDGGNEPVVATEGSIDSGIAVAFDHASFAYERAAVAAVNDVSFALDAGCTIGIIGGTGSGKSTLVSLVARLYDVTAGSVRVFGTDVRRYPLEQLRDLVATVPQQASLISGTIRQNLCWRDADATDDELWNVLACAQAADFVHEEEGGLDATVDAGGKNFSGGQRQRLTIARALVGHPRIVILDDSASALDFATDARLRRALRSLDGRPATIIVSQRVSAVMGADQVLVLEHGRVAGLGPHARLVKSCPLYREICLSQLKPEEVDA